MKKRARRGRKKRSRALRIRKRTPQEQALFRKWVIAAIHFTIRSKMVKKPPHKHWKKRKLEEWRLEEAAASKAAEGGNGPEPRAGYSGGTVAPSVASGSGMKAGTTGGTELDKANQKVDNGQRGDQKGEDVSKKDAGVQVTCMRTCLTERIQRQRELKRRLVNSCRLMKAGGSGEIEVIDLTKDDDEPPIPAPKTVELTASAPPQEMEVERPAEPEVEQEAVKAAEEQDPPPVLLPITAMAIDNDMAEKDVVNPPKLVSMQPEPELEPKNGSPTKKRKRCASEAQSTSTCHVETRSQTFQSRKDLSKLNQAYVDSMPGLNYETPCLTAISSFQDAYGQKRWICLACREYEEAVASYPMICCENCDDWYHIKCVQLERPFADDQPWFCRRCIVKAGLQP